jgi:hypothetical protein
VARLRSRFDDAQLFELTYLVTPENMRARVNHALGITAQGYTSGVACPVPFEEQIREAMPGNPAVRTAAGCEPDPVAAP